MLAALEAIGLASGIARNAPLYAALSASHILGIALLLGPIILVDLALLGWLRGLDGPALRLLRRAAALGAAIAVATGALLLTARPLDYASNAVLLVKLAVVAAGLTHALVREARGLPAPGSVAARLAGGVSLGIWLAALGLGRWVAFV
jgi:hypothetical protein